MWKKLLTQVLAAVAIFVCGVRLGYNHGLIKASNYFTSTFEDSLATKLNNEIRLLNFLRNRQVDPATEMLERLVDVDVNSLGVRVIKENRKEPNVIAALKCAKQYRDNNPGHAVPNGSLAKTIDETFQKVAKEP